MAKNQKDQKNLHYENKSIFPSLGEKEKSEVFDFCEDYRKFITLAKTEREFCEESVRVLEANGFTMLEEKSKLKAGDKVYTVNRGKGVFAAVIGSEPIENGVSLVGAHI